MQLFNQVLGQPTFPEDALTRIKNQLLAGFEYQKQNPGKLASLALFERLYGTHPYAHSSDGNAESIPTISREQLQAFHSKAYTANNAIIALVGDLSRNDAESLASQVSGGGGFGTRLMTEVREKRGLTYGVYSGFSAMQARGPFMINLQTRAELSVGTLQLVKSMLADFINNGPTAEELNNAKRELAGSFPLSTASNAAIVGQLGSMGFYDLPLSYLEDFMRDVDALSVEQVKAAMAKHLNPDALVIVTAGPSVAQKELPPPTDNPAEQPTGVPEH